jgi:thymidylate kinase
VLIVLEGTDGGGKTTLAAALKAHWEKFGPAASQFGPTAAAVVIHTGPPADPHLSPFEEYELPFQYGGSFLSQVLRRDSLIILDRWHVGDIVYGPAYRGYSRLTPAGMLHCEMTVSSLGAAKVICSPPLEVVQKRVANDGDDYIRQDDLPRIHAAYLEHAKAYNYIVVTGEEDPETLISDLFYAAERHSRAASLAWATAGTYTGALHPRVIIVGDELGPRNGGSRFQRPFTPFMPGAATWLLDAMLAAGLRNDVGMINAHHPGLDLSYLSSLFTPSPRWVALGSRASTALASHGIVHSRIHHPQFSRRFRHAHFDEYVADLKAAAGSSSAQELGR